MTLAEFVGELRDEVKGQSARLPDSRELSDKSWVAAPYEARIMGLVERRVP